MKALSLMNGHLPQQLRPSPRTLRTFLHVYLAYARINSDRKNALPCAVDVMRASLRDLCRDWDGQPMDLAEAVRQTAAAAAPLTRIQPKHGQVEKFWKLLKQQPQDEVNTAIILEVRHTSTTLTPHYITWPQEARCGGHPVMSVVLLRVV